MSKAEELWKQIDAYRRRKMTQDEIDDALMEYIDLLEAKCYRFERHRHLLLVSINRLALGRGFSNLEDSVVELVNLAEKIGKE